MFHISKVKIFKGEPRRTRADELRDGKLDKFEGEGGGYKYWPLDPDEWEVSEIMDHRGEKASGKWCDASFVRAYTLLPSWNGHAKRRGDGPRQARPEHQRNAH
eukprot:COSAG06_NODE_364_length_16784_cov_21.917231_12_plen_103_part_00